MSLLDWSKPPLYEVFFPADRPPDAQRLMTMFEGVRVDPVAGGWMAKIERLAGCSVEILCSPSASREPGAFVRASWGLSDAERAQIGAATSSLGVRVLPGDGPVLSTRKRAHGALGELMRLGAVGAVDLASMRVWSASAIADELLSDADLDVESLYCMHCVTDEEGGPDWIHTHGLAALGGFDVDLLDPSQEARSSAPTFVRALAYAIIEGTVVVDEPYFELARPGGAVRMVPAVEFVARAEPRFAAIRDLRDADHTDNRSVLCEPESGRRSLLRRKTAKPEPSRFIRQFDGGSIGIYFSRSASAHMAHRARQTLPVLRAVSEEFGSLGLPVHAKIGCPTDSGDGDEHLWFEVHAVSDETLDATLLNQPFDIAGMRPGDRGRQPIERVSDWEVRSPVGTITPNHFAPIRDIRDRRDEIEREMRMPDE